MSDIKLWERLGIELLHHKSLACGKNVDQNLRWSKLRCLASDRLPQDRTHAVESAEHFDFMFNSDLRSTLPVYLILTLKRDFRVVTPLRH